MTECAERTLYDCIRVKRSNMTLDVQQMLIYISSFILFVYLVLCFIVVTRIFSVIKEIKSIKTDHIGIILLVILVLYMAIFQSLLRERE